MIRSDDNVHRTPETKLPEIDDQFEIPSYADQAASMGEAANRYAAAAASAVERGHGILAESANHIIDRALLRDAVHVGGDNARNGADRIVDGIFIQSKYCRTGSACIADCFGAGGFKYVGPDGMPMQIEVPKNLYDDAVKAMSSRIERGEVPGVTDPAEASRIVRKGHLDYEQARNLARSGKIESLTYDVATGTIVFAYAFGLSAAVSFAQNVWSGKDLTEAAKAAGLAGLEVGGVALATTVIAKQLARTSIDGMMIPASRALAEQLGAGFSRQLAAGLSGKTLSGAAATSHVAKLIRGNVVTGIVTTAVLSSVDVYRLCDGSISGSQAFKNVTNVAVGVASGTGGWMAGAAAGAAVGSAFPIVGNVVGGIIGGLIGSFGAGAAAGQLSKMALDALIEDDAKEMARILEKAMGTHAWIHMLTKDEVAEFVKAVTSGDLSALLRQIYKADDRVRFCHDVCDNAIKPIIEKRTVLRLPPPDTVGEALMAA